MALSNLPLVDKAKVVTYLRDVAKIQTPIIEVSNTFPSEDDNIAYGLYVDDVTDNGKISKSVRSTELCIYVQRRRSV